jgi:hypothetical protein
VVGYNVQAAVDAEHHLIVAHDVTNDGHDRAQLTVLAVKAKEVLGTKRLTALADRSYFNPPEILACEEAGIIPLVPSPSHRTARPKAGSTRGTSSTTKPRMSTRARQASGRSEASSFLRVTQK